MPQPTSPTMASSSWRMTKHTSLQTFPGTCIHGTPMDHRSLFCYCWYAFHILLLKCRNGLHDIRSRLSLACIAVTYVCVYSGSSVAATDKLATAVSRYAGLPDKCPMVRAMVNAADSRLETHATICPGTVSCDMHYLMVVIATSL